MLLIQIIFSIICIAPFAIDTIFNAAVTNLTHSLSFMVINTFAGTLPHIRKQILDTLTYDYPQIIQQISSPIQQLLTNFEQLKTKYEKQNHRQKDYLNRMESFSNLPNDTLQKLEQEIEHLKGRFTESVTEVESRTIFIKKIIKSIEDALKSLDKQMIKFKNENKERERRKREHERE
ncbi:unnamed protein product [Adineta steineri]|uniref:Prion-inhibition and propagation HeLo domain-containing protein n=1 Tax=Adineta steineri TaxID=433720 RepID=A0A815PX00_9BILA|nr:unnamed protein product [Adineta steineri]CAF1455093.1 unnamed protein product [Adineta steineri]CAF1568785.1 unnamed protein product [Adineta steineri]